MNGIAPPAPVTAVAGSVATIDVANGPGNPSDWVGLFMEGSPGGSFLEWKYLNGSGALPPTGVSDATVFFTLPVSAGVYEVRFFANGGQQRLATSSAITTVSGSEAQISVNDTLPPTMVTVLPEESVTVSVTSAPGSPTDWVALAAVGAEDGTHVSWQYLNGSTTAPTQAITEATLTFAMPATEGEYEFRLFANNGFGRVTTDNDSSREHRTSRTTAMYVSVLAIVPHPECSRRIRDIHRLHSVGM